MTWWGTRKKPSLRLKKEILLMQATFPKEKRAPMDLYGKFDLETSDLDLVTDEDPLQPYWLVRFRMHDRLSSRIKSKDWFTIKIKYSKSHPNQEPYVFVLSHNVSNAPHVLLFSSGALCLHAHKSARSGWDPGKSTAATFGLWAVQWIRAWLRWKKTRRWPSMA
jgi:hypothetical protein